VEVFVFARRGESVGVHCGG